MNMKREFVIKIPMTLFNQLETISEKAVMMAILSFSDNGRGECWAGQRAIAKRAGCSGETVVNLKKKWFKSGLLKKTGKKKVIGGWADVIKVKAVFQKTTSGLLIVKKRSSRRSYTANDTKLASELEFKKPFKCKKETWSKTLLAYKECLLRFKARGEAVKSPQGLFNKILKDKARELGDHTYLASTMTKPELKALIEDHNQTRDQAYFIEAEKRRLL